MALDAYIKFYGPAIMGSVSASAPERGDVYKEALDGLQGSSRVTAFSYELDYEYGGETTGSGGFLQAGEESIELPVFSVTKHTDAATQQLYKRFHELQRRRRELEKGEKGDPKSLLFETVILTVFRGQFVGGTVSEKGEYKHTGVRERSLRYELSDCFLKSITSSIGASTDDTVGQTDKLEIEYRKMRLVYSPNAAYAVARGAVRPPPTIFEWDVLRGKTKIEGE